MASRPVLSEPMRSKSDSKTIVSTTVSLCQPIFECEMQRAEFVFGFGLCGSGSGPVDHTELGLETIVRSTGRTGLEHYYARRCVQMRRREAPVSVCFDSSLELMFQ